jgi:hypothetical protein
VVAICERLGIVTVATVNLRDFATVRPLHIPAFITVPGEKPPWPRGTPPGDSRTLGTAVPGIQPRAMPEATSSRSRKTQRLADKGELYGYQLTGARIGSRNHGRATLDDATCGRASLRGR